MPTPVSGAYDYPPPKMFQPVVIAGEQPEVYSLWMFVFNFPIGSAPFWWLALFHDNGGC